MSYSSAILTTPTVLLPNWMLIPNSLFLINISLYSFLLPYELTSRLLSTLIAVESIASFSHILLLSHLLSGCHNYPLWHANRNWGHISCLISIPPFISLIYYLCLNSGHHNLFHLQTGPGNYGFVPFKCLLSIVVKIWKAHYFPSKVSQQTPSLQQRAWYSNGTHQGKDNHGPGWLSFKILYIKHCVLVIHRTMFHFFESSPKLGHCYSQINL